MDIFAPIKSRLQHPSLPGKPRAFDYFLCLLQSSDRHYSQVEKEVKAVEWSILTNQIYLYCLRDEFRVNTDHKPLVPLLSGYQMRTALYIERMRVRLQRFDFHLNYIPGKSTVMERNEMVTQHTRRQQSQPNTKRKRRKWWRSWAGLAKSSKRV